MICLRGNLTGANDDRSKYFLLKPAGPGSSQPCSSTIRDAISQHGEARIIAATGASQFDFLDALTKIPGIDWKRVEMFHLDEYVGMSDQAPASFCKYLRERLIDKVGLERYHLLDGTQDPAT